MGQTLTHGIYLPAKGERNCYDGLASNWSILDGAVGTVAEHSTALAGKAPLVHTHTKSDITDFPAYGTTAGTICEGNDSRLSDARTPVAHTHGKADITDLLNSNFIPSANNSYDLGSSSYQWNNLYAKNYYYNGVAWGLDKANVWSANQKITNNPSSLYLKNTSMTMGTTPASNKYSGVIFQDSNDTELGNVTYKKHKNSNNVLILNVKNTDGANNYECSASLSLTSSGSASFYPEGVDCNLGQATTPWKTLNGINPGALSLPSKSLETINDRIYNPDGQLNAIDLNGGANYWTSDCDCYIYFFIRNDRFSWIQIYWPNTGVCLGQTYTSVPNETSDYSGYIPVPAGTKVIIKIKGTHAPTFSRVPCQGNV